MFDAESVNRSLNKALADGATEAYRTIRREAMRAALRSGDEAEAVRIAKQHPDYPEMEDN